MDQIIDIYHGSHEIVRVPQYGLGRINNDFGQGFYCTESEELAKEWACSSLSGGFANHYILDTSYMSILNINSEKYSILNWMAVLVSHRKFRMGNPIAGRARKYLDANFALNIEEYDIITGYRADDAYYDFADAFLNNAITVEQLARAMHLGKLGEQIVIKSRRAFEAICYMDHSVADMDRYYPIRKARNERAEAEFQGICNEDADGLYMIDIIRGGITNDDDRIPRNIP